MDRLELANLLSNVKEKLLQKYWSMRNASLHTRIYNHMRDLQNNEEKTSLKTISKLYQFVRDEEEN